MADQQNIDNHLGIARLGLNLEQQETQLSTGVLTYALNANVFNFDGNSVSYQNDGGNTKCVEFPSGYKVLGVKNITTALNKIVIFLVNPATGDSQIGTIGDDTCVYEPLIDDTNCIDKLAFSLDNPIYKVIVKTTDCSTQIYWTDGKNPRRYLDFNDLPWKDGVVGNLDSNLLLVQPNFSIPEVKVTGTQIGGELVTGSYQFAIQYANSYGESYTSFYSITNPYGLFIDTITPDFNVPTTRSLTLTVSNLDMSGLYSHFNLAVIKTINSIPTVKNIGTFPIINPEFNYAYTGVENSKVVLTLNDIFEKYPYYDLAQDVFEVDDVIGWSNLTKTEDVNYQSFWSNVKLQWVTYRVPYNTFEAYNNPVNTGSLRGYMRDEIYAFEGCFILKNGMQTKSFHIPGRLPNSYDLEVIPADNQDVYNSDDNCLPADNKKRWEVYNTGNNKGAVYTGDVDDCYVGPWEYGDMSYWQSSDNYDDNTDIWGDLAGQPIRHHKFPDNIITNIHDNLPSGVKGPSYVHHIFPIGVRIDPTSIYVALQLSGLSQSQIDNIAGFKILRGNRVNNKTVIAKGLMNNVGKYTYTPVDDQYKQVTGADKSFYYPNYPYNDLRQDPYFTNLPLNPETGYVSEERIDGFNLINTSTSSRFSFHSPDTHFYQPAVSTGLQLKIETIESGLSYGEFFQLNNNAKYLFLSKRAVGATYGAAVASMFNLGFSFSGTIFPPSLGVDVNLGFNPSNAISTYQSMQEIFFKVLPYINMGYFYGSYGLYNVSHPVENSGQKCRYISRAQYLIDGYNSIEDGNTINNYQRESSVYLHTGKEILFPHLYPDTVNPIPQDISRYNIASYKENHPSDSGAATIERETPICSYYASIKNPLTNPYGQMYSYETLDTGFYSPLYQETGAPFEKFADVFGGDIFINRFAHKQKLPIFTDSTVGDADQTDVTLDMEGNFTYPMFWLSTKVRPALQGDIAHLVDGMMDLVDPSAGFLAFLTDLFIGPFVAWNVMVTLFGGVLKEIGNNPNINFDISPSSLDNYLYLQGIVYHYVYGIPYYFVESEVNCDYRQATNNKEGDFYPHVGNGIPDAWLQENNVSIAFDNIYTYNQTYSKQNKENLFTHLRPDYDPNNLCHTYYPNRAIWSEASSMEETSNSWLSYKPASFYDFTKSYGNLISLDKLENRFILARFENKSQLYNAMTRFQPTDGIQAYLGNAELFSGTPPLDLSETDTGSFGTQHKMLLKTEAGHIYVDAKRGQVVLLQGTQRTDLAEKGMDKWFSQNLPFNILKYVPNYQIDNTFKGVGLTGTYDNLYKRLIITKLDYIPKEGVFPTRTGFAFNNGFEDVIVEIGDPEYFIDMSWTLSYNFITQSWVSFHSFTPNYYIPHENYFQSGINKTVSSLWNHNTDYTTFTKYYDTQFSYILEYPFSYKSEDEILQSVVDYTKPRIYRTFTEWYSPDETIYYNKAILYNEQQCSGVLNLVPKNVKDLSQYRKYPKYNTDSKDILVTKSDNFFQFNTFWDTVKDKNEPIFIDTTDFKVAEKMLNQANIEYAQVSYKKYPLRAKYSKVRMILDNRTDAKLISQFMINQTITSKK